MAFSRSLWRPQVLLPLLLALMIVVHGHYVFSPTFWVYRYDAYLVGFGIFVAAVALAPAARAQSPSPGLAASACRGFAGGDRCRRQGRARSGRGDRRNAEHVSRALPDGAIHPTLLSGRGRDRQRSRRRHLLHRDPNPGSGRAGRHRAARDHATHWQLHERGCPDVDGEVPARDRDHPARMELGRSLGSPASGSRSPRSKCRRTASALASSRSTRKSPGSFARAWNSTTRRSARRWDTG